MPEDKLKFLGDRIRSARKDCGLTQQALADQADLAVKTIQDVERGRKNTTYETLCQLIERLGISPNNTKIGTSSFYGHYPYVVLC